VSEFKEAFDAITKAKEAKVLADKEYEDAKIEWKKLNELRGTEIEPGQLQQLIKKYAPVVLKTMGYGGIGTAVGGLLENQGFLSGIFSKVFSVFGG